MKSENIELVEFQSRKIEVKLDELDCHPKVQAVYKVWMKVPKLDLSTTALQLFMQQQRHDPINIIHTDNSKLFFQGFETLHLAIHAEAKINRRNTVWTAISSSDEIGREAVNAAWREVLLLPFGSLLPQSYLTYWIDIVNQHVPEAHLVRAFGKPKVTDRLAATFIGISTSKITHLRSKQRILLSKGDE